MFEKTLQATFEKVFDFKKVRYDQPGESREQETMFVEVENARASVVDGEERARVEGKVTVFVEHDKMPFGYFAKCIEAHPAECKDLFFFAFEENQRLYGNIVQRGFSFVYFFRSQYDPDLGTLNQVNIDIEVNA